MNLGEKPNELDMPDPASLLDLSWDAWNSFPNWALGTGLVFELFTKQWLEAGTIASSLSTIMFLSIMPEWKAQRDMALLLKQKDRKVNTRRNGKKEV